MTGPRAAPRGSSFPNPSTPKARSSKSKSTRPRSSPSQRRASPNIPASTAAVVSNAAAAAAAAAAVPTLQQASLHHHSMQMALQQIQQQTTNPQKRARSSIGTVKEPDQKRAKQTASVASSVTAPREPIRPPSSPTTSSRSRQRKPSKTRSAVSDGESSPALAISAVTSINAPRPRPPSRARTPNARAPPLPQQVSCFSVEGTPLVPNVRPTSLQRRLFGHEIQCLMHAFGEVRYCARDVLEMTEDSVRDAVIRVAILAHEYAVEEAVVAENAGRIPVSREVSVEVRHVARCLRRDARAVQRLNVSLKQSAELHPDIISGDTGYAFTHTPKLWDTIAELASVTSKRFTSLPMERARSSSDIMSLCSWRAILAFRTAMTTAQYHDFAMCRGVTLVRQESKSRAPTIRGQPRITLFREWMNASQKLSFPIPDSTLFALGHVAWEAVGLITQTALLHRHFDDLAKGFGDPRAANWSYPRHLIAALNYGLGTAVMVPLTDIQAITLQQEIDTYLKVMQVASQRWGGYSQASSPCLLPQHVREALRRIERTPDSIFGFRDKSFLSSAGLL